MLSKQAKMLRLSALSLAVAGAMSVAPSAANAEVAASVSVANMYLWRGYDLGQGDAAVSGDITFSTGGFYAGVWGSSGDAVYGTEYDLFAGYGMEIGGFSVDLSVWNYMYPSAETCSLALVGADIEEVCDGDGGILDDFGGLSDAVLSLGFAGFSVTGYDNIAGNSGYNYVTVGYGYDAFSILVGKHDVKGGGNDMVHVDVSYAYNDNLSFTLSQQVDQEDDDDLKFVLAYSLPLEM